MPVRFSGRAFFAGLKATALRLFLPLQAVRGIHLDILALVITADGYIDIPRWRGYGA